MFTFPVYFYAMQEINAWLQSSQNFYDGVKLYGTYGKSNFLKTLFASGPTPYNIEKLEAELKAIAPTPPALKKLTVESLNLPVNVAPFENIVKKQVSNSENHKVYLALQEQQKTLYRQLDRNMIELDLQKNELVLKETAKQICFLHKKIQKNYFNIDFFDEKGFYPGQEEKPQLKTDEIQRLQVSLSKAKKRLSSGKCRDIQQTQDLITEQTEKLRLLQSERYNR